MSVLLVLAPHPDDEVLGVGGTIARCAGEGISVVVAIVTKGYPPRFDEELIAAGRREARVAHELLGVKETLYLGLPAAELDQVPHADLNERLGAVVREVAPDRIFVPFAGDLHVDHQRIFLSALVAARPVGAATPDVLAYETLSETNWNAPYLAPAFAANCFVDITATLERKLEALAAYRSQLQPFPHERSLEAVRALAISRGAQVGLAAAEAFVLLRQVL